MQFSNREPNFSHVWLAWNEYYIHPQCVAETTVKDSTLIQNTWK